MLSLFLANWPTKTIAVIENLFKLLADSISTDALWCVWNVLNNTVHLEIYIYIYGWYFFSYFS